MATAVMIPIGRPACEATDAPSESGASIMLSLDASLVLYFTPFANEGSSFGFERDHVGQPSCLEHMSDVASGRFITVRFAAG